jgi:hypothetical protein
MVTLDYIIIGIVLISAIAGLMRGFLLTVCSLVTWVLAVWLSWKLAPSLVPHLGGALRVEPYSSLQAWLSAPLSEPSSSISHACPCSAGRTVSSDSCWAWRAAS